MKATAIDSGIGSATRYIGPDGRDVLLNDRHVGTAIGLGVKTLRPSDGAVGRPWYGQVPGRFGPLLYIAPEAAAAGCEGPAVTLQMWRLDLEEPWLREHLRAKAGGSQ